METEKVCVNLSAAELGAIDVLVAQGLYTNRSDVIRAGVRSVSTQHEVVLDRVIKRAGNLGVMYLGRGALEKHVREGTRLRLFTIGILVVDSTVTAELADQAIEHVRVLGAFRAPGPVLAVLQDRISRGLEAA